METMYEKVRAILAKQLRVDAAIVTLESAASASACELYVVVLC